MNIVVAFTLEAFLLEYDSQQTKLESLTDKRIKDLGLESDGNVQQVVFDRADGAEEEEVKIESGVQFKLVRGMTGIDDLLEKMFVAEISTERLSEKENISKEENTVNTSS